MLYSTQPTIVIDFETSGPIIADMRGDGPSVGSRILGFGIVLGFTDSSTGRLMLGNRMSVGIIPADTAAAGIPRNTKDWHALWRAKGWDEDCFSFWSDRAGSWVADGSEPSDKSTGHLPALEMLWSSTEGNKAFFGSHSVVTSYAAAAEKLDAYLAFAERMSPTGSYTLVSDCVAFDLALAFGLLASNGFYPMTHTRSGQYRWHGTYDEESLLMSRRLGSPDQ